MALRGGIAGFLALAGSGLAASGPAQADDLRGALIAAYHTNPTLAAARDDQRATDEGVPLARADGLPSLTGAVQEEEFLAQSQLNTVAPARLLSLNSSLSVPIYSGGAVRNAVKAAEIRVRAGQAGLRGSESGVFSSVVAAYMDVILDEAVVRLNRANTDSLDGDVQSTTDRFKIGSLTRTDVAQSQSRLAVAKGQLLTAQSNLITAREHYIQLVGTAPVDLQPPPPLPGLPESPDAAVAIALDNNPDLIAAHERSKAARFDVSTAEASRLPKLSLFADGGRSDYLGSLVAAPSLGVTGPLPQISNSADVGIRATIPLFQGGRPAAQVRQAQAREGSALDNEIGAERAVIAQVRASYAAWSSANAIIAATQTALDASQLSLEGVKAENSVGNRTVLDILNAEQEFVSAEVQLVTARRNAYVAGFSLLAAMGKAEARDLGLDGGPLYDPEVHYRAVRGNIWDWGSDPKPRAQATRTVDTPAQGSEIPKR